MPDEDIRKLNPQVASAIVGIRNLRNIDIFPLSVGDQLAMTSILKDAFVGFSETDDEVERVGAIVGVLQQNIPLILEYVTDTEKEPTEKLLKDITNSQALDIAEIVFEQNYADLIKKVRGLFERVISQAETLSPSRRPSQPSVKSTDTDSQTSTEESSVTAG